jgi:hypothetical protein
MNRTALAAIWPPDFRTARLAGHEQISPVQAIRRKCLDCCGHQVSEVKLCEAVTCALWPFRAGRHPYTKTRLQEADSAIDEASGAPVPSKQPFAQNGLQEARGGQGGDI